MARVSPRERKMPILEGQPEGLDTMAERREHTRFTASSLSYIDLGESNGGLILNLSEGGVSVQAAEVLIGDIYPRIRFHLPKSEDWIDTGGRIVWRGRTKKEAGIRFVDMPPYTRRKIREWLAFEANQDESHMTWQTIQRVEREETWTPTPYAPLMEAPQPLPPPTPSPAPPRMPPLPRAYAPMKTPVAAPMREPQKAASAVEPVAPVAEASAMVRASLAPRPAVRYWKQLPEHSNAPRFRLLGDGGNSYETVRGSSEPHHWVLMTAVTCVVGTLCFIAGMSVRPRYVPAPPAKIFSSLPSGPAAPLASPSPVAPAGGQVNPPANGIRTSAAAAAPGMAGVGNNTPVAGAASGATSAPVANPATKGSLALVSPASNRDAPVVLNMEEIAVGASAFVAITTRLSVMVPASFHVDGAQENSYLHVGDLVYMIEPTYPPDAIRDRIEGTVVVVARFGPDGTIERVDPFSGPDILSAATIVAVRQWRYAPTYLYGHAIEAIQHVKIVFRLP